MVCVCKHTLAREVWGHAPQKIVEAMRLLLIQFWAKTMLLGGQTTEFYTHKYLPFLPVSPNSSFPFAIISQATPFTDEACETINCLLGRRESCCKTLKRFFRTVCSHLILFFNRSPCCARAIGFCQALALFGNAMQAMGEGKSGPVEIGLTGPVATALIVCIS